MTPVFLNLRAEAWRLSIFWTAVLLFSASQSPAQIPGLPAEEPSREWLGREYADAIFGEFRRRYPDMPLVIEEADLQEFSSRKRSANGHFRNAVAQFAQAWSGGELARGSGGTLRERLVAAVKTALPAGLSELTTSLEWGRRLEVSENGAAIEKKLKDWLWSQPDHSVAPHEFMVEALRLAKGRVIMAWVSAWNIARADWEMASTRNYGTHRSKFVSLTGEAHLWRGSAHYIVLPEREWSEAEGKRNLNGRSETIRATKRLKMIITKRGDEFSYLYHRIGVELYSMVIAKMSGSAKAGQLIGRASAIGEYLKYTGTAGLKIENKKRVSNDMFAADTGSRLFQLVTGKKSLAPANSRTRVTDYLKPNPSRYGTNYRLPGSRPAHYFGAEVDPKYWADTMSLEELRYRFEHAVRVDSKLFDSVILASTGEAERLHRGLVQYMREGARDEALNGFIKQWISGVIATPKIADVTQDLDLKESNNEKFAREAKTSFDFVEVEMRLLRQLERVIATAEGGRHRSTYAPSAIKCQRIFAP